MKRNARNVFVNVPFDEQYEPLFEALVFSVVACGYRIRCALEDDDSGNVRIDKLDELVRVSRYSIHDLSRTELNADELPRFNMPFELGLAIGAKRFGNRRHDDRIKIMVNQPYRLPAYLSDLGGNDPSAHRNKPESLIKIVRDFLHVDPTGRILPGPAHLAKAFNDFNAKLPLMAGEIDHDIDEISGFKNYRSFVWCIVEYLRRGSE